MEPSSLYEAPFSSVHAGGPDELFSGNERIIEGIFEKLKAVNFGLTSHPQGHLETTARNQISYQLKTLAKLDLWTLATSDDVANKMPVAERLSPRTIQPAIRRLVKLDLAERPEGDKHGTRLTLRGRRLVSKIAD